MEKSVITKQWNLKRQELSIIDLYIQNVRDHQEKCFKNTQNYLEKEISAIHRLRESPSNSFQRNVKEKPQRVVGFQTEFNKEMPYINIWSLDQRIRLNESKIFAEVYFELIKAMCLVAFEYDLFNNKNGSHICINLFNNDKSSASGYILLAVDHFYRICPNPDFFLKSFVSIKQIYNILT